MDSWPDSYFDGLAQAYSKRACLREAGWKDEEILASMTVVERFFLEEGDELLMARAHLAKSGC